MKHLKILLPAILGIAAAELVAMILLRYLGLQENPWIIWLDAFLLVLISAPFIYFLLRESLFKELTGTVERLREEVARRERSEEEIHVLNANLSRGNAEMAAANRRLLEIQQHQKALLDSIPDIAWLKDRESRFIAANRPFGIVCGVDPEELVGKTDRDIWPEELAERYRDDDRKVMESRRTERVEEPMVNRQGLRTWIETIKVPILGDQGQVIGTAGIARDITERKNSEEIRSELAAIVESSDDAISGTTLEGIITSWNKGAERLHGYEAGEVLGRNISCLVPPDRIDEIPRILEKIRGGESVYHYETVRMGKDGRRIDVSLTLSPIKDATGKILGASAIAHDITERRRMEEDLRRSRDDLEIRVGKRTAELEKAIGMLQVEISERKRAESALREGEDKLRLILESTGEAIYGIDLEGRCTVCNPSLLRLLGYRHPDDLLGRNMHELIHHTRSDGTPYPEETCRIFQAFRKREGIHADDEVFWRADGTSFPVEYWSYPQMKGDEVVGGVVAFVDITERRSLEHQLRQAQKMEAVGRLAGGVAHDFNNLLTIILGYTEALNLQFPPGDPSHKEIAEIHNAGTRAAGLTRQLLAFSRKQILQPRVIGINTIVTEMDKMIRRLIGEDIGIVTVLEDGLWDVKADPGQIEQVVMNLAVNAKDAMPGGGKLTIETSNVFLDRGYSHSHLPMQPGPYVMLAISDTGTGMDEATKSQIFDPFFTTKEKGKGTGLGLSTVYGIVKQSGGYIWVYSEPGKGSTFKVYLPRTEVLKDVPGIGASIPEDLRGEKTVLVVEDDESIRKLAVEVLGKYGYTVLSAGDGEEALGIVGERGKEISLVLTDVIMPRMGGRELYERLRQQRPGIKFVFMSGYTDDAIVHQGLLDPRTAFLQKPYSPVSLARKVKEVLAGN